MEEQFCHVKSIININKIITRSSAVADSLGRAMLRVADYFAKSLRNDRQTDRHLATASSALLHIRIAR